MKKILLAIVLMFSITAVGCSHNNNKDDNGQQGSSTIKDVDVKTFVELLSHKKPQVLDVRTPEEWTQGVIKGAIMINFFDADFNTQLKKLDKAQPVYVYCKSGGRSRKTCKQLEKMGFIDIFNLKGGISAWSAAGKETVK